MSVTVGNDSEKSITVVGELVAADSEGGFGPDEITVDGEDMSAIVAKLFGRKLTPRGSLGTYLRLGRVRLTIKCE